MKYKSELINDIVENEGHCSPSLHYESECIGEWIESIWGAYPKLCDYEGEWLDYYLENGGIGKFPYLAINNIISSTIENTVPIPFKSAILKGSTKYRDIVTGEILETFEEGRNLELVSVQMPVLTTTGKNLFDESQAPEQLSWGDNVKKANVKENTTYVYSSSPYTAYVSFKFYDNNGNETGQGISINNGKSFTTPPNTSYLKCHTDKNSLIQIEEGTQATPYEPYKTNILTVNEEVELRGIGDVKDELDLITGEVTERIGEIVLDGTEEWNVSGHSNWTTCYTRKYILPHLINKGTSLVNDKMKSYIYYDYLGTNDVIGVSITNEGYICFKYLPNGSKPQPSEVSDYLKSNPITIQYPLETESIRTVDLSIIDEGGNNVSKLNAMNGITHIETNGTPLKPTFSGEIPVEAITQNLHSFTEEE